MASFRKSGKGWRAEIFRKGIRISESFEFKAAAQAWAGREEAKIIAGSRGEVPDLTFSDLLERYRTDVSALKKGFRWESIRIKLFQRDPIAQVRLRRLAATDASAWRDRRLKAVSAPSVRREWNLLSHACNIAVKEWHWLQVNPFAGVRRPKDGKHRERLPTDAELKRLAENASTRTQIKTYQAFLFGGETCMRASEICGLREIAGSVARLADTKNGTRRDVPLSAKAKEIWAQHGPFGVSPGVVDKTWRDLTKEAKVTDLHFHDSRHWAITKLSKKLDLLQLAKMAGIKDPRILMVYFNETAEDIAKKL